MHATVEAIERANAFVADNLRQLCEDINQVRLGVSIHSLLMHQLVAMLEEHLRYSVARAVAESLINEHARKFVLEHSHAQK